MAQTTLANVELHAGATRAGLRLAPCSRRGSPGTCLTVSDDGRGFDIAAVERRAEGGIGLAHMRERIEALGGRLSIRSGPRGTEIEAFLRAEERDQEPAEERRHGDDQNPA